MQGGVGTGNRRAVWEDGTRQRWRWRAAGCLPCRGSTRDFLVVSTPPWFRAFCYYTLEAFDPLDVFDLFLI
jgi:hypothetical protein